MKKIVSYLWIVVLVITIGICAFLTYDRVISKADQKDKVNEINERLKDAKVEKDKEFFKNGFSKEYYDLEEEVRSLEIEKDKYDMSGVNLAMKIFPIIFILVAGLMATGVIYSTTHTNIDLTTIAQPIEKEEKPKKKDKFVSIKCPNCGSSLKDADSQKCEYCGQTIIKQ